MIVVMVIAIFSFSAVNAQTTKNKSKAKKSTTAMRYQCPMKCEGDKTYAKNGKCPVCNMQMTAAKKSTAAYQCAMKCEAGKTYAKAGKCPVCEMNLTKVASKKTTVAHEGHKM